MSILEFMEMGIAECLLSSFLAFVLCLSFASIGRIFVKGKGLALQSVIGMALVSTVVVICMSWCAALAKYIIWGSSILSLLLATIQFAKYRHHSREIIKSFLPVFLIFIYFIIRLLIFIVPRTGFVDFNCHETYFAAPALEIFKADYFSRLRLIDVYPYEWSRYHFFNASFTSIPLAVFLEKNYVSFCVAKFLTIALYLGSVFDCIRKQTNYKKAVAYFAFGCIAMFMLAYNMVTWSSFTNNYSSLILMVIVWILMLQGDWKTACIITLVMAESTSRSTLTGILLFFFALYMFFKTTNASLSQFLWKEWLCAVCCFVIGIGSVAMVCSGASPDGQGVISAYFTDNAFNRGWFVVMPLGAFFENKTLFVLEDAVYQVHLEFLILAAYFYLIIRYRTVAIMFIKKQWKILLAAFVLIAEFLFIYTYRRYGYSSEYGFNNKKFVFITAFFVCSYFLPIFTVYISTKKSMHMPYCLFLLSSLIQFMILGAASSVLNYTLIVSPLMIIFSKTAVDDIAEKKSVAKKMTFVLVGVLGLLFLCKYDFQYSFFANPKDYYYTRLKLQTVPYSEASFDCRSEQDAELAKLNALKGNRVHYISVPTNEEHYMVMNSMTMRFLPERYMEEQH